MDSRGNRLGVIALGVSLVALMVAFGGRWSAPSVTIQMPDSHEAAAPATPGAPAAAAAPAAPHTEADATERHQDMRGPWGRGPDEWRGRGGFGPFMFMAGVMRTLIGLALIGMGLMWLRRRRGPGGWRGPGGPGGWRGRGGWRGPGGPGGWRDHGHGPEGRPGPEYQNGPGRADGPQVTHL